MSQLEVVSLGFDVDRPDAGLPKSLVETGWTIVARREWPSDEWLRQQKADLFVLRVGGIDHVVERTRTLGRLTGRPVLWIDSREQEPDDLWLHLNAADWPTWAVLPPQVPRWQVVAVCRSLVATARRVQEAKREAETALQKLEDRKLIERAKGILMDRFHLPESVAYKRLRDTAMRHRKPLREIAQTLIEYTSHEPSSSAYTPQHHANRNSDSTYPNHQRK